MTGSSFSFSVMSVFVKRLAQAGVPQFELVFFRSWVNFLLVLPIVLAFERIWPAGNKRLLLARGLAGFAGASCLFYGVSHLPLSIAAMINWSSPAWVILFSWLLIGEKLPSRSIGWIVAAFVGLVLLLRVDFSGAGFVGLPAKAVLIAMLGAMFGGLAYVAVRAATAKVGVNTIILYFTGVSTLLSAPLALPTLAWRGADTMTELVLVGVFASFGQFCMTQGYRHAAAGLVSTMSLLNAAFSLSFGWILFGERLVALQWAGMALLSLAIAGLAMGQSLPRRLRSSSVRPAGLPLDPGSTS
jgi:S-adenosylmethionine uptake transporter